MRCPILLTGSVTKVIAQGDFVRQVQEALARRGFDPGPIDGLYGPKTAAALNSFQVANLDTFPDRAWAPLMPQGVSVAACATYRALGMDCTEVFCDIGILTAWLGDTAKAAAICTAVALAADQKVISLRCPGGGLPGLPPLPPGPSLGGRTIPIWAIVAGGLIVVAGVGWVLWRGSRR